MALIAISSGSIHFRTIKMLVSSMPCRSCSSLICTAGLLVQHGAAAAGSARRYGSVPAPGGWNRIALRVSDLSATVAELSSKGARFRTGITTGVTVRQILLHDTAGNLVELFEPTAGYHERTQNPAS